MKSGLLGVVLGHSGLKGGEMNGNFHSDPHPPILEQSISGYCGSGPDWLVWRITSRCDPISGLDPPATIIPT